MPPSGPERGRLPVGVKVRLWAGAVCAGVVLTVLTRERWVELLR